jgi:hypothetical protein
MASKVKRKKAVLSTIDRAALARSKAAKKGWKTRRARQAALMAPSKRSEAAKKGWETRRARQADQKPSIRIRSEAAKKGWETRRKAGPSLKELERENAHLKEQLLNANLIKQESYAKGKADEREMARLHAEEYHAAKATAAIAKADAEHLAAVEAKVTALQKAVGEDRKATFIEVVTAVSLGIDTDFYTILRALGRLQDVPGHESLYDLAKPYAKKWYELNYDKVDAQTGKVFEAMIDSENRALTAEELAEDMELTVHEVYNLFFGYPLEY